MLKEALTEVVAAGARVTFTDEPNGLGARVVIDGIEYARDLSGARDDEHIAAGLTGLIKNHRMTHPVAAQ